MNPPYLPLVPPARVPRTSQLQGSVPQRPFTGARPATATRPVIPNVLDLAGSAEMTKATEESATAHRAILVDVGPLFFGIRDLYEGGQLNYDTLAKKIRREVFQIASEGNDQNVLRVMWSAVMPQNERQARFLEYAERKLGWTVRRFHPAESLVVDPLATPDLTVDERGKNRLIRFDSSIAFAIGRLAETHQIALISDSFALAEPLSRAARLGHCRNAILFFGRLLDPRWQARLRTEEQQISFHDLDAWEDDLIGDKRAQDARERSAWNDDFLIS